MSNQVTTMKKTMMMILLAGGIFAGTGAATAGGLPVKMLEGDQKTACEAILCLAAVGSKPSECTAPLRKYFSITASKPSKLKERRKNFLKMCPADDTAELVNSLVSGKCNPQYQDCAPAAGGGSGGGSSKPGQGDVQQQLR